MGNILWPYHTPNTLKSAQSKSALTPFITFRWQHHTEPDLEDWWDREQKRDRELGNIVSSQQPLLNISKVKVLVIDFRKQGGVHIPRQQQQAEMEVVKSFNFLGVNIINNLFWSNHIDAMVKKAH